MPENFADNDGEPPHTKRLKIPARLLCADVSESETEVFEEKRRDTSSRAIKNAGVAVVDGIDKEMNLGFSKIRTKAEVSGGPMPVGAITFKMQSSQESQLDLLKTAYAEKIGARFPMMPAVTVSGKDPLGCSSMC